MHGASAISSSRSFLEDSYCMAVEQLGKTNSIPGFVKSLPYKEDSLVYLARFYALKITLASTYLPVLTLTVWDQRQRRVYISAVAFALVQCFCGITRVLFMLVH